MPCGHFGFYIPDVFYKVIQYIKDGQDSTSLMVLIPPSTSLLETVLPVETLAFSLKAFQIMRHRVIP